MRSIGMRFTQFLLVGHLRLDGSSESVSRRAAPSRRQLRLVMCSICMRYRQLLLVGQLSLEGSSENASQGISTSGSVLSFPKKEEGNVRFSTNLQGVRRSARSTSMRAPKAHRMMGKTQ